jgi:hypothetical protein
MVVALPVSVIAIGANRRFVTINATSVIIIKQHEDRISQKGTENQDKIHLSASHVTSSRLSLGLRVDSLL